MSKVIFLADLRYSGAAGTLAGVGIKSDAVSSPPVAATIFPTSPREGVCRQFSIRESEDFDAPTNSARSSRVIFLLSRTVRSGCVVMLDRYVGRNDSVNPFVALHATNQQFGRGIFREMSKKRQGQHFIRKWREHRGLSVRNLADLIAERNPDSEQITFPTLSRIENGKLPFSEATLNVIADALNVTRTMLLETDPQTVGHPLDLLNQMDPRTREQAVRMLELMLKSSAA